MTAPRYDVIAIGNAIVDVMAPASDELVEELGMTKGGMTLVDAQQARDLYDAMGPAKEISGGSAANTLAGLSGMGAQCAFVGQVAPQLFPPDVSDPAQLSKMQKQLVHLHSLYGRFRDR